jgi:hypothetical protein
MTISSAIDFALFDKLIDSLRTHHYHELAHRLDFMLRNVAWTSASELLNEFGNEAFRFRSDVPDLSPELNDALTQVCDLVMLTLPEFHRDNAT